MGILRVYLKNKNVKIEKSVKILPKEEETLESKSIAHIKIC